MRRKIAPHHAASSEPHFGTDASDPDLGRLPSYVAVMAIAVGLIIAWVAVCVA